MTQLYTQASIIEALGIPRGSSEKLKTLLKGVKPVYEHLHGNKKVCLYSPTDIDPIVAKYKFDHLPSPAAVKPTVVVAGDAAQLRVLSTRVDVLAALVEERAKDICRLMTEQNRVLLTQLNKQADILAAISKDLGVKTPEARPLNGHA